METIVVAAVVLVVLVVLIVIFTGKTSSFIKGTKDCGAVGGECTGSSCRAWAEQRYGPDSSASELPGATEGCAEGDNCCKLIYNAPGGTR